MPTKQPGTPEPEAYPWSGPGVGAAQPLPGPWAPASLAAAGHAQGEAGSGLRLREVKDTLPLFLGTSLSVSQTSKMGAPKPAFTGILKKNGVFDEK